MDERVSQMLRRVRQIEISTNRQVSDALAGAYHSVFKGQGMDFEESREYQPGDEIRSIDWNVTARTGKPHVKVYREERELTMMLVVDLSASNAFGSGNSSKRELAAEVASTLAFSASRNSDKVGLAVFTDKIELLIPPRKGREHILRLIREILFFEPKNRATDIACTLDEINRLLKRKAIVVLISDFLQDARGKLPDIADSENPVMRALDLTNRRHDLVCLGIADEREARLPKVGIISLEDSETGEVLRIDSSKKSVREAYERMNAERKGALKKSMARIGVDFVELYTNAPFITELKKFFERRRGRRA